MQGLVLAPQVFRALPRAAMGMECLNANGFMVSGALSPPVFLLDLQRPNTGANRLVDKARSQSYRKDFKMVLSSTCLYP